MARRKGKRAGSRPRKRRKSAAGEKQSLPAQPEQIAPGTQTVPVKLPDNTRFDFWIDEDGDPCLGNVCFNVKLDTKHRKVLVRVKSGGTCPVEMDKATKALYHMFEQGGLETLYELAQERTV